MGKTAQYETKPSTPAVPETKQEEEVKRPEDVPSLEIIERMNETDPERMRLMEKRKQLDRDNRTAAAMERVKAKPGTICVLCGNTNVSVTKTVEEITKTLKKEHIYVKCHNPKCKYVGHFIDGKLV